jgi:phosphonatase-like hydrolase
MVVFDMAGTTVNEDNVVYKTLQRAVNDHGYNFSLDQVLAEGAGKEKFQAIKSILKLCSIDDDHFSEEIYQHFTILLNEAYQYLEVRPQPNALELFQVLKRQHIAAALNTGYSTDIANALIDKLGWQTGVHFDALVTASDVKKTRPEPDMVFLAMNRCEIQQPGEVVKVGDSIIDIEEGKNASCALSIGITTGAHSYSQLLSANPDFIISDLLEIPEIIARHNRRYSI